MKQGNFLLQAFPCALLINREADRERYRSESDANSHPSPV
jgi:hypothetical protein